MKNQKRLRDYGITIGSIKTGKLNAITDVEGVLVGHTTLSNGDIQTGVTAIIPHAGNVFEEKLVAAGYVINGFGKTTGFIQIEEMGTIETPIIMANTLSVGTASDALVEYMLSLNSEIGLTYPTVNPLICECNDGYLNDIRGKHVKKEHIFNAISTAAKEFEEGAVGAGTGMSCYELKGGIGSASRVLTMGKQFTIGVLVLTNFGILKDLILAGIPAGKLICQAETTDTKDKGSVIIVIATDIPLSERQLKRLSKRASVGLARTGSYMGSGSGELCIAFTTSNRIDMKNQLDFHGVFVMDERHIDDVFRATAEAVEEAVLNSMLCAATTHGRNNHIRQSLIEYMNMLVKNK
ncbi:MAG: DmpA family aminopeptidase [Ruminiclostridium sp.]